MDVLHNKLKEQEVVHAQAVAKIQSAADTSEERRLEVIRLWEEGKQLPEAG